MYHRLMDMTGGDNGLAQRLSPVRHPVVWVCVVHLTLAVLLFEPKPFSGGDNFWYMLLGESLREGEGYRDLWLPSAPAHTRYPPVYPILLAALGFINQSVIALKLLSMALTTATAALVFLFAEKRTNDRQVALFAGLAVACAPIVVEYSHWVLSEPAFVFFVVLALYAFARDTGQPAGYKWFAIGTAAAVLAALTRSAGYPLILAVALALGLERRWRRAAIFVGVAAAAVGGWWLRNKLVVSGDVPYSEWLLFRDPYRPELGTVTPVELVARFWYNLKLYTLTVLPESFGGRDVSGGVAGFLGIVLAAASLLGATLRAKKLELPELFLALYLGLVLLWPEAWGDQRLLLPVLPLIAILALEGFDWAFRVRNWTGGAGSLAFFAAGSVLVGVAAFGIIRIMPPALDCAREYWRGSRYACYPPAVGDFVDTAIWARENTEVDAVIINRKPQIFYWYGRRPGDVYPFTTDADSMMRFLDANGASHVVVDTWSATTFRYLIPAIQSNVDRFDVLNRQGNPPSYLLRYKQTGEER